ncbi:MAG: acyl-CoA synthetase [Pseudomonadota bacterium]|nr:acyl-CoA synthetase [Pseudomonadota bacterium]
MERGMKSDSAAPTAAWARQRERSNLTVLRMMRWLALVTGRRVSRLVLHGIVVWFLVGSPELRRHSRAYLDRALGRKARWTDLFRHVFTFAATLLDRVYLLQERFDDFEIEASGVESVLGPVAEGKGALVCGAHMGSFEALRMIGHGRGLRVAMIMYEGNARLINDTLAKIAPRTPLHTIALGHVDAMLSLRRWLDDGGVAGLLADRSLQGPATHRSKTVVLPFLGAPARFPDGPFRLAALLRRKIVFMAGLYRGGRRYELRFEEIADFSSAEAIADRDAAIRSAVERYVRTLEALCREAPYNWFNFFDFWADAGAEATAVGTGEAASAGRSNGGVGTAPIHPPSDRPMEQRHVP